MAAPKASTVDLSVLLSEKEALRDELKHLKLCQLSYFTMSVTATGALLALGGKLGDGTFPSLLFFSPLVIILPCWWIFFDKATTIARIVGYLSVLDRILSVPDRASSRYRYVGWEAALLHYRGQRRERRPLGFRERARRWPEGFAVGVRQLLTFQTSHRYWSINYYTYAVLALVCWALGSNLPQGGSPSRTGWALLAVILASCFYNLYLAGDLIGGSRSFAAHAKNWAEVLHEGNIEALLRSLPGEGSKEPPAGG